MEPDTTAESFGATAVKPGLIVVLDHAARCAYRRPTLDVLLLVGALLWALRVMGVLP